MIEESYVRFDTAKMLKEAGFNEPCHNSYDNVNGFRWFKIGESTPKGWVPCPTQALAARWLREVHKLLVFAFPNYQTPPRWQGKIYNLSSGITTNVFGMKDSYEEAMEEGLIYAIESIKK